MMATTHALVGLLVGAVFATVAPSATATVVLAGVVGGVVPDLDLYVGHRRTLHFPTYYAVAALPVAVAAVVLATPLVVAAAAALVAAAAHCRMDAYGGGLELEPWAGTSDRAVYDHFRGEWRAPRRWVRYDGAPEDLGVAAVVALPGVLLVPAARWPVAGVLLFSAAYVLARKRLARLWAAIAAAMPAPVARHLPERFHEGRVGE